MSALDMTRVYKKYKGLWVALEGPISNKVVASDKTLKGALEKARKKGYELPTVTQIPERILPIVGLI